MKYFADDNDAVPERIRSILGSVECYVNLLFGWILFIGCGYFVFFLHSTFVSHLRFVGLRFGKTTRRA